MWYQKGGTDGHVYLLEAKRGQEAYIFHSRETERLQMDSPVTPTYVGIRRAPNLIAMSVFWPACECMLTYMCVCVCACAFPYICVFLYNSSFGWTNYFEEVHVFQGELNVSYSDLTKVNTVLYIYLVRFSATPWQIPAFPQSW